MDAAAAGATVMVDSGTYVENLVIGKNLSLTSIGGKASTTIQGIPNVGAEGTIHLSGTTTAVTIGGVGAGFTIIGFDNGNPASETAAVYVTGSHSNTTIRGNEMRASGDLALLSAFSAVISNMTVDGNVFSGQTFVGTPAGLGTSAQFTTANIPRQLVVLSGGGG